MLEMERVSFDSPSGPTASESSASQVPSCGLQFVGLKLVGLQLGLPPDALFIWVQEAASVEAAVAVAAAFTMASADEELSVNVPMSCLTLCEPHEQLLTSRLSSNFSSPISTQARSGGACRGGDYLSWEAATQPRPLRTRIHTSILARV